MSRKVKHMQISSTHKSFAFMVILAQCFAMFPVCGVTGPSHRSLSFRWKSARAFYCLAYLCFLLVNIGLYISNICTTATAITFGHIVTLLYLDCGCITSYLFIRLAKDWPYIMQKWAEIDLSMESYGFPTNLRRHLKIVAICIMTAAALEHSFFLAFAIGNAPRSYTWIDALNRYLETNFSYIFLYIRYNIYIGLLMQLLNIYTTFSWNYMDLFIMLISIALSARFKQVVERLRLAVRAREKDQVIWMAIREDYDRLNKLCRIVDDAISNITLLSFANNLFVILVQLFNSLEPKHNEDVIERIYFIYSFGFLIIRTILVSLFASQVDSESKEPIDALNSLPHDVYNVEVDRLLYQVKMDPSAFTGRRFFKVTKSLILSIAGAIVTYELILIQFNAH